MVALLSRRLFVGTAACSILAGCASKPQDDKSKKKEEVELPFDEPNYGPLNDERFPIPALNRKKVKEKFLRRKVEYETSERFGTVIVDTKQYYLFLVQKNGMAIRYGVGLGKAGFEWSGRARIEYKAKWPTWTPPDEMIERRPELEKYSKENGGMKPGLENPLGARALYIYEKGVDTLYRIHGTPDTWSIGKAASSGCVRMLNHDIIDLYSRVRNRTPIVVI